jgi:glycosyltransferase involved in cell wall biosynthesis
MLWYFPIEAYEERYTSYLSTPDGFWETFLKKNNVKYRALRGEECYCDDDERSVGRIRVGKGQVLDTYKRCAWAMDQVKEFLLALDSGQVKDGDVLFIEDFWHPGFEALPYARDMYGVKFKIYAWCHADSWDKTDFTYYKGMEPWKRYFELGIARCLEGMFVADAGLKELASDAGVSCPIYAVGTCWDTEWIRVKYGHVGDFPRDNIVVFASRWDEDKDPEFYCNLVESVMRDRRDVKFYVTTGFEKLVSNKDSLLGIAIGMLRRYPENFDILTNVTKANYFTFLKNAKVHFNCAHHDWVSYALLESVAMGCMPLFPDYRSFPLALQFDQEHLYVKRDLDSAKEKLYALLEYPLQKPMSHILRRFDNSISYVANVMGLL